MTTAHAYLAALRTARAYQAGEYWAGSARAAWDRLTSHEREAFDGMKDFREHVAAILATAERRDRKS